MSRYPPSSARFPGSESFAPSGSSCTGARDKNFGSESTFNNDNHPRAAFLGRASRPSTNSFSDLEVPLVYYDDSRTHDGSLPHSECERESYVTTLSFSDWPHQEPGSDSSFQREQRAGFSDGANHPRSISSIPSSSSFTNLPSRFDQVFGDASIPGGPFIWAVNPTCKSCSVSVSRLHTYFQSRQPRSPPQTRLDFLCNSCLINRRNFPGGPPLRSVSSTWQDASNAYSSGRVDDATLFDSQPGTFGDSRRPGTFFGPSLAEEEEVENHLHKWSTDASKGSSLDRLNMPYLQRSPVFFGASPAPSTSKFPSQANLPPQHAPRKFEVPFNCDPHWHEPYSTKNIPVCGDVSGRYKDYCLPCEDAFLVSRDNILHEMSKDMSELMLEEYLQKWLPNLARAKTRFIGTGPDRDGWAMNAAEYMKKYFGENKDETDDATVSRSDLGSSAVDENTVTGAGSTTQGGQSGTETTRSRGRSTTSYSQRSMASSMPSHTTSSTRSSGRNLSSKASGATSTDRSRTVSTSTQQQSRTTSALGSRRISPAFTHRFHSPISSQSRDRETLSYKVHKRKYRDTSPTASTASEDRNQLSYNDYIAKWGEYTSTRASSVARSTSTASVTDNNRSRGSRSQKSGTSASRRSTTTASQTGTESTRGHRRRRNGSPASTNRTGTTISAAITELRRHSSSPQHYRSRSRSISSLDSGVSPSRSRSSSTSSVACDDFLPHSHRHGRSSKPPSLYKSNSRSPSPSSSETPNNYYKSNNSDDSDNSNHSGPSSRSRSRSFSPQAKTLYLRAAHPSSSDCPLEYMISLPGEDLTRTHFGHHDQETGEWIECPFWDEEYGGFSVKHKRDLKGKGKEIKVEVPKDKGERIKIGLYGDKKPGGYNARLGLSTKYKFIGRKVGETVRL